MWAPQPDVFTITCSTPAASKVSMVRRARASAVLVLARVGRGARRNGLRPRRDHLGAVPGEHARRA